MLTTGADKLKPDKNAVDVLCEQDKCCYSDKMKVILTPSYQNKPNLPIEILHINVTSNCKELDDVNCLETTACSHSRHLTWTLYMNKNIKIISHKLSNKEHRQSFPTKCIFYSIKYIFDHS